jgi:hypothetical protein
MKQGLEGTKIFDIYIEGTQTLRICNYDSIGDIYRA